ncbi:conjugative transfer signal peptidase TraF [Sphingobium sp. YR657]|nr:conjugative transfer signal peptidase TraF [Sphingobium sp. YR657]
MMRKSRPLSASLPLFDWHASSAGRARPRPRPRRVLITGGIGLMLVGAAAISDFIVRPAPRIVWNASASAPIGLWRIHALAPLRTGDMVLIRTPISVRKLAAQRHYLPANIPLLKRVVARDGDEVCALANQIFVNGRLVAQRYAADRQGRPLPHWQGCEQLRGGRVFLLMDVPDSFDGRYFGAVDERLILGKATPLWLR